MWLLPDRLGAHVARGVEGQELVRAAALVLALTMATHLMTGYLAMLTIGVWVLIAAAASSGAWLVPRS